MRFEYFKRRTFLLKQKYGWHLIGGNNEIINSSGAEGFNSREDAERNARLTRIGLNAAHDNGQIESFVVVGNQK